MVIQLDGDYLLAMNSFSYALVIFSALSILSLNFLKLRLAIDSNKNRLKTPIGNFLTFDLTYGILVRYSQTLYYSQAKLT